MNVNIDSAKKNRKPSICLALIHNNNKTRNALIRPNIAALATSLEGLYSVESIEVSWQPEIKADSFYRLLKKRLMFKVLDYQWSKYLTLSNSSFLKLCRSLFVVLKKYPTEEKHFLNHQKKNSAIHAAIIEKHISAWDFFLKSKADILVCFEDDALFKKESHEKFLYVLKNLQDQYLKNNVYVDLAGGFALPDLKLENLKYKKEGFLIFYKKAVTNTACVYLTNRLIIERFKSILSRHPFYRFLPIDWAINKILIEMDRKDINSYCFHTNPTVFEHGSATGKFKTWQQ